MKTLVVLGAADGGLPTYLAARRLGYRTIAVDQRSDATAVDLADEFLHVSIRDADRITEALGTRADIAGVLSPSSDLGLPTAQQLARQLGLPHLPDPVVRASLDKAYFHELCTELGLASYRVVVGGSADKLSTVASELRFPVLVKPTDGSGSRAIRLCRTHAELDAALPAALANSPSGVAIVEEQVVGDHYTLEGFLQDGRLAFAAVTARTLTPPPHTVTTTHRIPSGLPAETEQRLRRMVQRICDRLGYCTGPLDVDAVVTPDGSIELIEMGARVGGSGLTELVRVATGVNVIAASIDAAAGLAIDLTPMHPPRPASLTILHSTRSGRLESVQETVRSTVPELAELEIVVPVGCEVLPYTHAAAKLGYAVLVADTSAQLSAAEHRLARTPLFDITPTGGTA